MIRAEFGTAHRGSWIRRAAGRFMRPIFENPRRRNVIITAVLLFIVSWWLLIPYAFKPVIIRQPILTACDLDEVGTLPSCSISGGNKTTIPNIVHFVYMLSNPKNDFPFQFSHFLSMYGASHLWQPDKIYLHTNVAVDSDNVARARSGESGKWSKLIFDLPNFTINTVSLPNYTKKGVWIKMMEHKSDFVRVKMVHDFGGIYMDLDVQPLRDIKVLRESGFKAIGGREMGVPKKGTPNAIRGRGLGGDLNDGAFKAIGERQLGGDLNSGTFMSEKGGKAIKQWMDRMHEVFDQGWVTHSNQAWTHVAEQLEEDGCEMLILGRDAFAPGSWKPADVSKLFDPHDSETPSPVDAVAQGAPLPSKVDVDLEPKPDWATDYDCTFLLHAFSAKNARNGVKKNDITPRYVLERRSNYARAVYPVAKAMYDEGLVKIDDTDLGT